jgi:uncharacterized membrane protein
MVASADMTGREAGFLLIGLGTGLILAVVATVELVLGFHHMFIVDVHLQPGSIVLALPFLLMLIGVILLFRTKRRSISNRDTTPEP